MNRVEITNEMMEDICGGVLCSGHNAQKGCDVTYLRSDINGKMNSPVYCLNISLAEWNSYVNGFAGSSEKNILEQALAEGKIRTME